MAFVYPNRSRRQHGRGDRRGLHGLAFAVALVASSLFFAALHLERPMPADPMLANYYRAALLAKYTMLALPLGWIFWRWGLPYAILCHAAINAAHFVLQGSSVLIPRTGTTC